MADPIVRRAPGSECGDRKRRACRQPASDFLEQIDVEAALGAGRVKIDLQHGGARLLRGVQDQFRNLRRKAWSVDGRAGSASLNSHHGDHSRLRRDEQALKTRPRPHLWRDEDGLIEIGDGIALGIKRAEVFGILPRPNRQSGKARESRRARAFPAAAHARGGHHDRKHG